MSTYSEKLRQEKKTELSQRISHTIAEEIWEMSLKTETEQEFVDYLMTVTDQEAIEEFFNKCHDDNGRFCGGSSGGGGKRGPGTHVPAPVDYVKQQVREKAKITGRRGSSAAVSKVTTSPVRRVVDITTGLGFNPSGFGTVKIRKLQKADLSNFGEKDLKALKTRLQASQRQYNNMHTMGYAGAALSALAAATGGNPALAGLSLAGAAYQIGYARWKTKRIPQQIERIDRTLSKRKNLTADGDIVELATDDSALPTLAQEIAAAMEELKSGNYPKPKLTAAGLKDVENLVADVEEDDDAPAEQLKAIKEFVAAYKKAV